MAFAQVRAITIDPASVSSDLTNFVFPFEGTFTFLRSVGSGGYARNASGFDIGFYGAIDGAGAVVPASKLDWEIEKWVSSTGEIIAHIRIPLISASVATVLYVAVGDALITTDQSNAPGVFPNDGFGTGYSLVMHLAEGANRLKDSAFFGYTVTATGAPATVAGHLDGAMGFNGTNQYLAANGTYLNVTGRILMEAWVYPTSLAASTIIHRTVNFVNYRMGINASGHLYGGANVRDFAAAVSTLPLTLNAWNFVQAGYDGGPSVNGVNFVVLNGVRTDSPDVYQNGGYIATGSQTYIGCGEDFLLGPGAFPYQFFPGRLDEVRISTLPWSQADADAKRLSLTFDVEPEPIATFPRAGAWQGGDRLLVWARFYGVDAVGDPKEYLWSGHMLWDPSDYEGGPKEARVLAFGYYDRPMSSPRGDVALSNVVMQLWDGDRLLRGMLGNAYQYALNNTEVVIKAILEADWRARKPAVTIFRGLVNTYDVESEYIFSFEFKDWLGSRLQEALPMVELTTALFALLPATLRNTYAPYLYGRLNSDASDAVPPTFVAEPAQGSFVEAGVYPRAGYGAITDCLADPPTGLSVTLEPGGALSLTGPNPGEFGFMAASIDANGKLSDPVPFYQDVDTSPGRGSFVSTPCPFETATPGNQQMRVDFTPGAGAVATRVWIGVYYYGAQWTYYLDVAAPGATVTFDKHPVVFQPPAADTMTTGGHPTAYTLAGSAVVAALMPDGETVPCPRIKFVVTPFRRPVRIAYSHPDATSFAIYKTFVPLPVLARTDWTFRAETDLTVFEFFPDGDEFDEVASLQSGTGKVPIKYVGSVTAPLSGAQFEAFLVSYGAVAEFTSAFQGGVRVDPAAYDLTWAVPGLGSFYATHFGAVKYKEINGLRFTLVYIIGPDAADAISGARPILFNLVGYETVGDNSGTALTSLYTQTLHLLKNQVMREDAQSVAGGDWLGMPQWADGTDRISAQSFVDAEADSAATIGSPIGGFMITEPRTIGEWIRRLLLALDCGFGWNREGQAVVALLPPAPIGALSDVDTVDHIRDILKAQFKIHDDEQQLFRDLPYAFDFDYVENDFARRRTLRGPSTWKYKLKSTAPELELFGRIASITAKAVGRRALQRYNRPERTVTYQRGLAGLDLDLGARYRIDHPEGATATGFLQRPAQVKGVKFNVEDGTVEVSSWDLGWVGSSPLAAHVVEEIMAEIDLGGSREFAQQLTDSSPQTVEMFDKPARPAMVQWEILPDDCIVTCYLSGRVEASGISMRAILYNNTDSVEVDDVAIVSTAQVDTSFTVPVPTDGLNKEYSLRMEITASGLPNPLSNYSAHLTGKIRTLFSA